MGGTILPWPARRKVKIAIFRSGSLGSFIQVTEQSRKSPKQIGLAPSDITTARMMWLQKVTETPRPGSRKYFVIAKKT